MPQVSTGVPVRQKSDAAAADFVLEYRHRLAVFATRFGAVDFDRLGEGGSNATEARTNVAYSVNALRAAACAMKPRSSGKQDPQLVPAFNRRPIEARS